VSIGDTLARARQDAGLSITQVSQRTRIRETIIRGIEHDDFSLCGGDFYARGHIRSVARVAGVDPGPLIQEYDEAHSGLGPVSAAEIFEPATPIKLRERRPPNWSAVMALAIVAVIVYAFVYTFTTRSHHVSAAAKQERKPAATASARPTPTPSPTATAPRRSVLVQLAATEDCWIGVYAPDGTLQSQAYIPAGSTRSWNFTHRVSMEIGNPGGIVLTVNGRRMNLPGSQVTTLSFRPGGTVSG
jgi:cytoskeletal protein RodZ